MTDTYTTCSTDDKIEPIATETKREIGELEDIICEMVKGDGFRILESSDCRAFGEEKGLTIQMYRPDWGFGVMSKLVKKLREIYLIEGDLSIATETKD